MPRRPQAELDRKEQCAEITRLAATIAAGLVSANGYETQHMRLVVRHSVDLALAIHAEVQQRL